MAAAPKRAHARKALEQFRDEFDAKYPKAVAKLDKDWARSPRSTRSRPTTGGTRGRRTAIKTSFAIMKLRTKFSESDGSKKASLANAYKLLHAAQERWRFNGHELVSDVLDGGKLKDKI